MLVEGKANSILTFFNKPSCYYIYIYIYTRVIYTTVLNGLIMKREVLLYSK